MGTMDQTRKDASNMKQSIKKINKKYDEARIKTAKLLSQLTGRATILEKLKARIGMATALSAFLQMNELSDEEEEDDDLLREGTRGLF